ncbi:unnamed protein product [Cyclocybe aegerita]|uniref:Glycosyltransferase 61 catalytic domain-containing protein n=1 Tax=Cyclocybe aegerita TaxID=1973307 RepID=A0A8S0WY23_CYCAE|nr:unnamed protein product [Cyclocybe aegerita]
MWMTQRRQQLCLLLIFPAVLLLLHANPQAVEHASSKAASLAQWTRVKTMGHSEDDFASFSLVEGDDEEDESIPIAETNLLLRPSGFTIYDRLYVWNGTIYAVTLTPESYPDLKHILSQGISSDYGNIDPTSQEMQIITPMEAQKILGDTAVLVKGMTFILYDSTQFMVHYYHWWGEIILGAIRTYSALSLLPGIKAPLAAPSRFLLPNVEDDTWRDYAGVDGPLMRAAFPSASIEHMGYWSDLIQLNRTFVFERAMIVSRQAAHKNPLASLWFKMISSTMNVTAPTHFWEPLRKRVLVNTVGYLPILNDAGAVISPPKVTTHPEVSRPVVLYVSRQGGGRRLLKEAHEGLVSALKELEEEGLFEVRVVRMELLPFAKQVEEAGRAAIMVGVHGNGLTHQLWMPPSPRSTVVEIHFPKTYNHDYVMLSRNMGHKHYAVWNDTTLTFPEGQWFKGVAGGRREDAHGNSIPVHGPTVAQLIRERLMAPIP